MVTNVTSWERPFPVTMALQPDRPSGATPWRSTIASPSTPADAMTLAERQHADDLSVVTAVLDGDRDSFRVLVERESGNVVRACHRVLGDQHEAEDIAQEAFVIAYRSLASWRGDGPFGAWLTRIAVRLAVRAASRRRVVPWAQPSDDLGGERRAVGMAAAVEPEREAIRAERAAAARQAVASLDEPYREVVALRFFGERSLAEIATLTGRPLGTVKTHLRRGLLRLRDNLGGGDA
jgi:RNA polymerase sigma-70 factor, ECF subfamily